MIQTKDIARPAQSIVDQLKAIAISTSRLAQQVALPATDSTAAVPTTATTASGDEA